MKYIPSSFKSTDHVHKRDIDFGLALDFNSGPIHPIQSQTDVDLGYLEQNQLISFAFKSINIHLSSQNYAFITLVDLNNFDRTRRCEAVDDFRAGRAGARLLVPHRRLSDWAFRFSNIVGKRMRAAVARGSLNKRGQCYNTGVATLPPSSEFTGSDEHCPTNTITLFGARKYSSQFAFRTSGGAPALRLATLSAPASPEADLIAEAMKE
ncbi:hypothetical protein EVAR_62171_1 [Eumeta japonica]|uniref:Uncharacterized protein n=1 Tax=Eumeta variegata TaxID=151549 RepID=A0A4C1ZWN9_EUMVA|nr:hypothetical protein EVAR_62171_1 [Eumeta japonica]